MNETIQTLLKRRACRNFKPDPVPREVLEQVLEAGTYAPTGMGKQSPIILAVTNKELRDRLSKMNADIIRKSAGPNGPPEGFDPFYGAPVVLVVLADRKFFTHQYDGSLVLGNLMNAAEALGLGSIWIHRAKEEFDSEEGKAILKELGVEGDYEGIGHCVLGYRAEPAAEPIPRKENYVVWAE